MGGEEGALLLIQVCLALGADTHANVQANIQTSTNTGFIGTGNAPGGQGVLAGGIKGFPLLPFYLPGVAYSGAMLHYPGFAQWSYPFYGVDGINFNKVDSEFRK